MYPPVLHAMRTFQLLPLLTVLLIVGCADPAAVDESTNANDTAAKIVCAPDNGGITLPDGFYASLVVDSLGPARHPDVAPNGYVYVKTRSEEGGIAALRDTTGDFRADVVEHFST